MNVGAWQPNVPFDRQRKREGKGKGKENGKRGEKGDKGSKGKPQGKIATEFSSYQPESEAGIEIWSKPDVEEGGHLSVCTAPSMHVEPSFICQNMSEHDPFLRLVDSGASRTVVSVEALKAYIVFRERGTRQIRFRFEQLQGNKLPHLEKGAR